MLGPGALVGLALALFRPRAEAERPFAALVLLFAAGLFVEASLYAASGSTRYQERYLMTLVPHVNKLLTKEQKRKLPLQILNFLDMRVLKFLRSSSSGIESTPFLIR